MSQQHTHPPLTPQNVSNIKLWYDALRSGKYQKCKGRFFGPDNSCCAGGLYLKEAQLNRGSLGSWTEILNRTGLSWEFAGQIVFANNYTEATFPELADLLHNHVLETYAIDLDDWPESAVEAPALEREGAAV